MHNNIMAAGSKDRPPMLGPGRYSQWRSHFLRYIDTKPNGARLSKCILSGPYVPLGVLIQAVEAAEDEIYSTVGACHTANEMWIAIERLQQVDKEQLGSYNNASECLISSTTSTGMFQNEVNDIRAERIAKSTNTLAFLTTAQPYSDNYYQAPKPQRSNATSSSTRPSASTRHKGKEIAKPITP
ncbi:hypothetical protein Tco_1177413 [Tanacetum coccineum]